MADFVNPIRPIFNVIFKIFCGHKSETMWCVELKISLSDGTLNTPSFVEILGGPYNSSVIVHGINDLMAITYQSGFHQKSHLGF